MTRRKARRQGGGRGREPLHQQTKTSTPTNAQLVICRSNTCTWYLVYVYLLSCLLLYGSLYAGVHQEQYALLGVAPFSEQPKSRVSVFGRSIAL